MPSCADYGTSAEASAARKKRGKAGQRGPCLRGERRAREARAGESRCGCARQKQSLAWTGAVEAITLPLGAGGRASVSSESRCRQSRVGSSLVLISPPPSARLTPRHALYSHAHPPCRRTRPVVDRPHRDQHPRPRRRGRGSRPGPRRAATGPRHPGWRRQWCPWCVSLLPCPRPTRALTLSPPPAVEQMRCTVAPSASTARRPPLPRPQRAPPTTGASTGTSSRAQAAGRTRSWAGPARASPPLSSHLLFLPILARDALPCPACRVAPSCERSICQGRAGAVVELSSLTHSHPGAPLPLPRHSFRNPQRRLRPGHPPQVRSPSRARDPPRLGGARPAATLTDPRPTALAHAQVQLGGGRRPLCREARVGVLRPAAQRAEVCPQVLRQVRPLPSLSPICRVQD